MAVEREKMQQQQNARHQSQSLNEEEEVLDTQLSQSKPLVTEIMEFF